jgi:predicted ArsR family transcriptional regulator
VRRSEERKAQAIYMAVTREGVNTSERLAHRFALNRVTVRKYLSLLVKEGLLEMELDRQAGQMCGASYYASTGCSAPGGSRRNSRGVSRHIKSA